jgi:hypothetical protein
MDPWWWSLPGVDNNQSEAIGNAAERPNLAQIPNELSLDSNSGINPALMQSFPPAEELPKKSSLTVLPDLNPAFFRQIANGGLPLGEDRTITIPYESLAEAREALLEARQKKLQELRFIEQQIENLEGKKRNENELVGGHKSLEGSFL